jgi:hypothetical protein
MVADNGSAAPFPVNLDKGGDAPEKKIFAWFSWAESAIFAVFWKEKNTLSRVESRKNTTSRK